MNHISWNGTRTLGVLPLKEDIFFIDVLPRLSSIHPIFMVSSLNKSNLGLAGNIADFTSPLIFHFFSIPCKLYSAIHICVPNSWYLCAILAAARKRIYIFFSVHKCDFLEDMSPKSSDPPPPQPQKKKVDFFPFYKYRKMV